jgi:sugar phosphate isomerase/epimerase
MKIGMSSPSFALQPFVQTFEAVAEHFELWEIVADLNQLLPDIAEQYREYAPSYDIEVSVHAPFNDLNIAALNPELQEMAIQYIKNTIRIAAKLEINLISMHPGHLCPTGVYYNDEVLRANRSSLEEIDKFAAEYPVTIALENMPIRHWTLGNNAMEILEMIADTQFGICFDIGHAFITDAVDGFLENTEQIYNLHIHDNNGRRDEHLILGEGAIDIPNIFSRLKGKYTNNIIIESNNMEEGIKSKKYLQNLLDKH